MPKVKSRSLSKNRITLSRLSIMLPGASLLIMGLLAGLSKMNVIYLANADMAAAHAPAMVFGFIGSLIVLERAVAVRRLWAYIAPPLLSVGVILNIFLETKQLGKIFVVLGLVVLHLIYAVVWKRQASIATAVQILAATSGLIASIIWVFRSDFIAVTPLAMLFLILTILGERIELGRVAGLTLRGERFGLILSVTTVIFAIGTLFMPELMYVLLGVNVIILVGWLFVVDIARSTVNAKGAIRYMAVCLLLGYVWLFMAGVAWVIFGEPSGPVFDGVTHAVLLGFVMSMIMAHASIILPSVLHIKLPYRKVFYVPLIALHIFLLVRMMGNARDNDFLLQTGGLGNALAVVAFLLTAVGSAVIASRTKRGA